MKNSKWKIIILMMISIINIACIIGGYIVAEKGAHSFNESLSPSSSNSVVFTILVLIIQILNIIFLVKEWKECLNNEGKNSKSRKRLIIVTILIVITFFIPVKGVSSVNYNFMEENIMEESTTYINVYRNIYSITIWKSERTHMGIAYY